MRVSPLLLKRGLRLAGRKSGESLCCALTILRFAILQAPAQGLRGSRSGKIFDKILPGLAANQPKHLENQWRKRVEPCCSPNAPPKNAR